jgi:hypothetical protein
MEGSKDLGEDLLGSLQLLTIVVYGGLCWMVHRPVPPEPLIIYSLFVELFITKITKKKFVSKNSAPVGI